MKTIEQFVVKHQQHQQIVGKQFHHARVPARTAASAYMLTDEEAKSAPAVHRVANRKKHMMTLINQSVDFKQEPRPPILG